MGCDALFFHLRGQQQHFQFDVQRAVVLILLVGQVVQWLGIAFRPLGLRAAKRRQRLGGYHPRRQCGGEALGQKRPQRLVFPGL